MKKLLLLSALLCIVFSSSAQYDGCLFTAYPDSACIVLNTWDVKDTLEETKGKNSTSSYKKILTTRFFVKSWKTPLTPTSTKDKLVIVSDKNTGLSSPISKDSLLALLGITNSIPIYNNSPNRSLSTTGINNTFTISSTKNARVNYTINFSVALVSVTSNGVVSLDYSTNGGSTWVTVNRVSQTFGVSILTMAQDNTLSGEIPANALVRIYRSANTNVTITSPTSAQQEVTQ